MEKGILEKFWNDLKLEEKKNKTSKFMDAGNNNWNEREASLT